MTEEHKAIVDFINSNMVLEKDWVIIDTYRTLNIFNPYEDIRRKMFKWTCEKNRIVEKISELEQLSDETSRTNMIMEIAFYLMRYINRGKTYIRLKRV